MIDANQTIMLIDTPPLFSSIEKMEAFIKRMESQFPNSTRPEVVEAINGTKERIEVAKANDRTYG